jgi:chaperonin cofactor prefoldin
MRNLTKKQKNILDKYKNIKSIEDLPHSVYEELEKINDTEILYNNVDNYLGENYES